MKSMKENWEAFAEPMKQEIENLRHIPERISDTVLDKIDEMNNPSAPEGNEEAPSQKKKGCLKKILVYGFAILVVVAFLKNGCSFNRTIERDASEQNPTNVLSENEQLYDACVRMSEENIAVLTAQDPIDTDALEEEYEFLLACLGSEYVFKSMAYGHFTGEYDSEKYGHIAEKCGQISEEMRQYLDTETADELYSYVAVKAWEKYDDEVFDYDACLIGTSEEPDINAMWYAHFDSLINAQG